jgi:mannose-6-phosphate isomerase-like protein (cupin superfamily)
MDWHEVRVHRVCFGDADARRLEHLLRHKPIALACEHVETDDYLQAVISKPWGREYRIYADQFFDIWKLDILAGQATSLHCHPRKETWLLCLSGRGRLRLLAGSLRLAPSEICSIGRGAFHATENSAEGPLELIEVEVPRNKLDLIRIEDRYGRGGRPYETAGQVGEGECCLAPLDGQLPGALLRRFCPKRRYRFAVERGEALPEMARQQSIRFVIALDAVQAIRQEIQVVPGASLDPRHIDSQSRYLAIMEAERS